MLPCGSGTTASVVVRLAMVTSLANQTIAHSTAWALPTFRAGTAQAIEVKALSKSKKSEPFGGWLSCLYSETARCGQVTKTCDCGKDEKLYNALMSDFERQKPNDPSKEGSTLPPIEKARADRDEFLELVKEIEAGTSTDHTNSRIRPFVAIAHEHANSIFRDAGKIPEADPRHEIFECYNAILDKWNELIQLRKVE